MRCQSCPRMADGLNYVGTSLCDVKPAANGRTCRLNVPKARPCMGYTHNRPAGSTCQRHVPTYCQRHVPTWDICQMSGNDPCARMAFGARSASNPILGRAKRLCRLPLYFTLTKKFPRTLCAFPIKFREKPCALLVLNVKVI